MDVGLVTTARDGVASGGVPGPQGRQLLVPQGFSASYFANSEFTAPIERSLEHHEADATRVDRRLAFGRPGAPDLPLYFFNDVGRFNFYQGGEPHRARLPFSVVWDGYVWVEEGERARRST